MRQTLARWIAIISPWSSVARSRPKLLTEIESHGARQEDIMRWLKEALKTLPETSCKVLLLRRSLSSYGTMSKKTIIISLAPVAIQQSKSTNKAGMSASTLQISRGGPLLSTGSSSLIKLVRLDVLHRCRLSLKLILKCCHFCLPSTTPNNTCRQWHKMST